MSRTLILAAALPFVSLLMVSVWRLLRCPHRHEIFDRYPDSRPALRCDRCLRLRPNILVTTPQYRLTQPGGPRPRPTTGIERVWAESKPGLPTKNWLPHHADLKLVEFAANPNARSRATVANLPEVASAPHSGGRAG